MASTPIIGVDFSGARQDTGTWVTQALWDGGQLEIQSCAPMARSALAALLTAQPGNTVAALDFPFSVPGSFAALWQPEAEAMPAFWEAASGLELGGTGGFMERRDGFVAESGEPLRWGDLYFPECYSCLHKANPNMVPMTFRGMQMLAGLWNEGCRVPPLEDEGHTGPLLLESMPGAALRAYGLPFKGYKNGSKAFELRVRVIDGLEAVPGAAVKNLDRFRDHCLASHDCLDSVAAAVTAALWVRDPGLFRLPADGPAEVPTSAGGRSRVRRGSPTESCANELERARLEGWLYAPVFLADEA